MAVLLWIAKQSPRGAAGSKHFPDEAFRKRRRTRQELTRARGHQSAATLMSAVVEHEARSHRPSQRLAGSRHQPNCASARRRPQVGSWQQEANEGEAAMRRVVISAFAMLLTASVSPAKADVETGVLECRGVSQQYVIASITHLGCLFRSNITGRTDGYAAVI